ncbi:hypothetical protein M3J09_004038 [Ascochyta lentis]
MVSQLETGVSVETIKKRQLLSSGCRYQFSVLCPRQTPRQDSSRAMRRANAHQPCRNPSNPHLSHCNLKHSRRHSTPLNPKHQHHHPP